MFISNLVPALLVACPVLAIITLPNGFQFDETKYLKQDSRASIAPEKCEMPTYGCSNDCSARLSCNEWGKVTDRFECPSFEPYCVQNTNTEPSCSPVFPMEGVCLTKATNTFVCAHDGILPDTTDCTKYHVCNGTEHRIETCPANHEFTYDKRNPDTYYDMSTYPGNGEYKCRFNNRRKCNMCEQFYCDGMANQFIFRSSDSFHYAYCIEIGPMKKVLMFKCPQGTRHTGYFDPINGVECVPIIAR